MRTHSRSRGTRSAASPRILDRTQSRSEPRNRNGSSSWIKTSREPRWRDLILNLIEQVLDPWQEWAGSAERASGGRGLYHPVWTTGITDATDFVLAILLLAAADLAS